MPKRPAIMASVPYLDLRTCNGHICSLRSNKHRFSYFGDDARCSRDVHRHPHRHRSLRDVRHQDGETQEVKNGGRSIRYSSLSHGHLVHSSHRRSIHLAHLRDILSTPLAVVQFTKRISSQSRRL